MFSLTLLRPGRRWKATLVCEQQDIEKSVTSVEPSSAVVFRAVVSVKIVLKRWAVTQTHRSADLEKKKTGWGTRKFC